MKIKRVQQVLGRMPIGDPFILGVHHRDEYPKGNGQLGPDPALLKDKNLGSDFDNQAKWRMYHGQRIPGFPYHPHRGFEIVTIVEEGFADHFDSRGSKGRYGNGDVQLMSAGKGVLHGEMFPLLNEEQENPFRLFQIWVNLPAKHKLTEPDYKMLWNERIPRHTLKQEQGDVRLKIILGEYEGVKALEPLKNSWAQDPAHHMGIVLVDMDPNTLFTLPAVSNTLHRYLLVYEGQGDLQIDGQRLIKNDFAELSGAEEIQIQNGTQDSQLIVLEGEPIGEPVAAHGPFVMNTQQELQLAFQEFRQTQFGGWPWGDQETDAVHPKDAGRFASYEFGEVVDKP